MDELIADEDKIWIFLGSDHTNCFDHEVAELQHTLKFGKQQVNSLAINKSLSFHWLLDIFDSCGQVLSKVFFSGQPLLQYISTMLALLDASLQSSHEKTNPIDTLKFALASRFKDGLALPLLHMNNKQIL